MAKEILSPIIDKEFTIYERPSKGKPEPKNIKSSDDIRSIEIKKIKIKGGK